MTIVPYKMQERTLTMFILNAPLVFTTVWAAVSPLVDPRTLKKIKVCGAGPKQLQGAGFLFLLRQAL